MQGFHYLFIFLSRRVSKVELRQEKLKSLRHDFSILLGGRYYAHNTLWKVWTQESFQK